MPREGPLHRPYAVGERLGERPILDLARRWRHVRAGVAGHERDLYAGHVVHVNAARGGGFSRLRLDDEDALLVAHVRVDARRVRLVELDAEPLGKGSWSALGGFWSRKM